MKLTLVLAIAFSLASAPPAQLRAQSLPSASTSVPAEEFEVATIRPAAPKSDYSPLSIYPNGRIRFTRWTLRQLICAAYGVSYWQIDETPAWAEKDQYDIEAKPPEPPKGAAYSRLHDNDSFEDPTLRAMLQALLRDRFQLRTHTVFKDGTLSVLERGNGALALSPSLQTAVEEPDPGNTGHGGVGVARGVRLLNMTMPEFARFLSNVITRKPVIDKTGLVGPYDFRSKIVPEPGEIQGMDEIVPMVLAAVKEMGLKLTQTTGPVTTLVIDNATPPSPN